MKKGRKQDFFLSKESCIFPCTDHAEMGDPKQCTSIYSTTLLRLYSYPHHFASELLGALSPVLQYAVTSILPI